MIITTIGPDTGAAILRPRGWIAPGVIAIGAEAAGDFEPLDLEQGGTLELEQGGDFEVETP